MSATRMPGALTSTLGQHAASPDQATVARIHASATILAQRHGMIPPSLSSTVVFHQTPEEGAGAIGAGSYLIACVTIDDPTPADVNGHAVLAVHDEYENGDPRTVSVLDMVEKNGSWVFTHSSRTLPA